MKLPVILIAGLLFFTACKEKENNLDTLKKEAVAHYAELVYAAYDDSYQAANALKSAIDAFVAAPSAAGLENCRAAWKASRVPYGQTEAYRFYGGPIDDVDGPEGLINAWPLDETYIDYVQGHPNTGIINKVDEYPVLNKALLESLNQTGGATEEQSEVNVATGYHAIEFLLWGQDFNANGPGNRDFTDYTTAPNATRRGQYLQLCAVLLLEHLDYLRDAWASGSTYQQTFTADPNAAIEKIFTGLGSLSKGELAGERMFVAVDSKDQENEHSCFSDNTHVDIQANFAGIHNVYYGVYKRTDGTTLSGTGFAELAQQLNAGKATATDGAFVDAADKISLIPAPFDQAILNHADKILTASEALKKLSDRLADVQFELTH